MALVQNRSISGPTKMELVLQYFFKKKKSIMVYPKCTREWPGPVQKTGLEQ